MAWPSPPFEWDSLKDVSDLDSAAEKQRYKNVLAQWRHYEPYFLSHGYTLLWPDVASLRYLRPWKSAGLPVAKDPFYPSSTEDFVAMPFGHAVYQDDYNHPFVRGALDKQGRGVIIKVPRKTDAFDELDIVNFLRLDRAERDDSRDHCLPILEVLVVGATNFVVMPEWSNVTLWGPFWNIAEVLDCCEQLLIGLVYLHSRRVAHRDIHTGNIYISLGGNGPLTERGLIHFRHMHPVKYAYADFGLASRFPMDAPLDSCKVIGLDGVYQAPEQLEHVPYNAFALDVYQLGQTLHRVLWNSSNTTLLEELRVHVPQLQRLLSAMIARDPNRRPTADQALQRLQHICGSLDEETLDKRSEFLDPTEMMPNSMKGRHTPPEPT